jgi:hypothetical protein
MQARVASLYFLIALVCLAAPFVSASRGLALALLPLVSLPFALVSVALGVSVWSRRGLLPVELVIAILWCVGVVALCVNVSSPPLDLASVFVGMKVQGALAGLAAIAALLSAFLQWRSPTSPVPRGLQTGALVVLGLFLGRRSLMALGALPSAGTIAAISHELWLTRIVLLGCALTIVGGAAALRVTSREV